MIRWLALILLFASTQLKAFEVTEAVAKLNDGTYIVNAKIEYHFSLPALEALDNGVGLTMETHVQVRNEKAWIWQKDVVDFRIRTKIQYLPVSSLYQVTDLSTGEVQNFLSRNEAISALGDINNLSVVHESDLKPGEKYRLELKSYLDIESLPLPLRPKAYISSDWSLSTGWTLWHLRP